MKYILALCVVLIGVSAFGQGAVPRTPRNWVDNYAKIVSAKGLVNPTANAFSQLQSLILTNQGRLIMLDSAITYHCSTLTSNSISIPSNTHIDLNGSTIRFYGIGTNPNGFVINGDNVSIENGSIWWTTTVAFVGASDGSYANPITIGEYGTGIGYKDWRIENIKIKHDMTDHASIYFFGRSKDFVIRGISADTLGSGALVGGHWGGANTPTTATMHPSNGLIENIFVNVHNVTGSEVVFLSGCYNINVNNVIGKYVHAIADVTCGDYGYFYQERSTGSGISGDSLTIVGQGIKFTNCLGTSIGGTAIYNVSGIPDTSQTSAAVDTVRFDMPVTFENCRAQMNNVVGTVGFKVASCRGVTLLNCSVSRSATTGVTTGNDVHSLKVLGGKYIDNGDYGIAVAATGFSPVMPVISGAFFRNNNTADIIIGAKGGIIEKCTFGDSGVASNSDYNIYGDTANEYVFVQNNNFKAAQTGCMRAEQAGDLVVNNNNYVGSGVISSNRYDGTTGNAGTVLSFSGNTGETFNLPAGAVIQPASSYLLLRAQGNNIRMQYNAGGSASVTFYGNDTDADITITEDSATFTKPIHVNDGTGAGTIFFNEVSGSEGVTIQGPASATANYTITLPNAAHTAAGADTVGWGYDNSGAGGWKWYPIGASASGGGGGSGNGSADFDTLGTKDTAILIGAAVNYLAVRKESSERTRIYGRDQDTLALGVSGGVSEVERLLRVDTIASKLNDSTIIVRDTMKFQDGIYINGEKVTDLTGTNLSITSGVLNAAGGGAGVTIPLELDTSSGIDASLLVHNTADHSWWELYTSAASKDVYNRMYTSTSPYFDFGLDASDSNRYKMSVHSSNYLDPDDSLDGDQASNFYNFQHQSRNHAWNGKRFQWRDTAGAVIMDLRDSGSVEVLIVDQVGDSAGHTSIMNRLNVDSIGSRTLTDSIVILDTLALRAGIKLNGDRIGDFTGTGLAMSGTNLTTTLGTDITSGEMAASSVVGGTTGTIQDQTITKADIDTTASDFVFDGAFEGTSAVADSQYATRDFSKNGANITDGTVTAAELGTASVVGGSTGDISDQTITKHDLDTTSSNFVFDGAFEGTSATADSQYATQGFSKAGTNITDGTVGVGELNDTLRIKYYFARAISNLLPSGDSVDQFGEFWFEHASVDTLDGGWAFRDTNLAATESLDTVIFKIDVPDYSFFPDTLFLVISYAQTTDSVQLLTMHGQNIIGSDTTHIPRHEETRHTFATTFYTGSGFNSTTYLGTRRVIALTPDGTASMSSATRRRGGSYYVKMRNWLTASTGRIAIKALYWKVKV